ncbi:nucleotide hydrolase [Gregarina niphandrodes]|uniref:Nucleotide hydrolase n=1 Tax=Gregarina niphandrodes TaxID=110365 RepID=A0A023B860_GRENI|nr:nucleotide hydrolase [Gregarina niphandrodes]EZG68426.1 nucleotide hydrolase [Gregarina niphandrodes]|eukprot:XP_011134580.1 nucleotide hydrolase [Gregarina niphandrodes]
MEDWSVFPQNWYDVSNESAATLIDLWPPTDMERRQEEYAKNGTRHTAVLVILAHRFLLPHLLVVKKEKSLGLLSIEIKPTQKSAEAQVTEYLSVIFTGGEVRLGELVGMAWVTGAANYDDPVPVLPVHCTRPREKISFYQVTLGHVGVFRLPERSHLKAVPLSDLQHWFKHIPYIISKYKLVCYGREDNTSTN